jgi:hypothetical protein
VNLPQSSIIDQIADERDELRDENIRLKNRIKLLEEYETRLSAIANAGDDLDMICQLAKLKGVKAVEINWPGGTGAIIRN